MTEIRIEKITTRKGTFDYPVADALPDGWQYNDRAITAPIGYRWANNGKSLFGGEYQSAIVKVND